MIEACPHSSGAGPHDNSRFCGTPCLRGLRQRATEQDTRCPRLASAQTHGPHAWTLTQRRKEMFPRSAEARLETKPRRNKTPVPNSGQRPLDTRQGDDIESYPLPFLPDFLCVKPIHGHPRRLQDLDGFLDQGCFANP